ncbi:AAA family ATPase [Nonomuraea sp. NPDC050643]|uniref:AAA family ATPase n=1 Tax=Nonomuraea sp. NPDC050643 TaxID=3155660 RepID=UPI0033D4C573
MLTRIEIDGFKSFLGFELDVPPFLALVGPNSSGKSNFLDALAFVRSAMLADDPELWPSEVKHWHFHVPDPAAMRRPASALDRRPLTEDAGNLAAVLGRMSRAGGLDDLLVDLAALVPDVTGVRPVFDERSEEWSFDLLIDHEPVPCRLASDGTLRVLALLAALYDRASSGLLMVEEIENGLHPSRLGALLQTIAQRAGVVGDSWRQVILTTHSPVAVSSLYQAAPDALVFLEPVSRAGGGRPRSRVSVAKPMRQAGEPGTFVSPRQGPYPSEHGGAGAMSRPRPLGLITDQYGSCRMTKGDARGVAAGGPAGPLLPAYAEWVDATSKALRSHGFL